MAANCTACGRELRAGARFCPGCGRAAVEDESATATVAPAGPATRRDPPLLRPGAPAAPGPTAPVAPAPRVAPAGPGRPAAPVAPVPVQQLPTGASPARRASSGRRPLLVGAAILSVAAAAVIGIALGHHASSGVPPTDSAAAGPGGSTSPSAPPGAPVTSGPTVTSPTTTAPLTTSPAAGPPGRLYAITQDVVVRDAPSTSATRLGLIPSGTMVGVQCKASGEVVTGTWGPDPWWNLVSFNGVRGYVTDEWVDTKSDEADSTLVPLC